MAYTTEEDTRYQELYADALARFADKNDFDATDWLDEEEATEFIELQNKINGEQ